MPSTIIRAPKLSGRALAPTSATDRAPSIASTAVLRSLPSGELGVRSA